MPRPVKILFILGAIFIFGPIGIGLLITVISMISAFHDLSQNGIASPQQLADHIGYSLMATATGVVLSGCGIAMIIIAGLMWAFAKPAQKSN